MNHPSEWTKSFDENTGRYRYKHPYIFDTFNIDGDNSARLTTCRLQYGTSFYPELDYDHDFKIRILTDLINFRYRKNDYNTGVQLQLANFQELYPII